MVSCFGRGLFEVMKKYLLLVEDEELWEKFKSSIQKDINSEIMELIEEKVKSKAKMKNGGKSK